MKSYVLARIHLREVSKNCFSKDLLNFQDILTFLIMGLATVFSQINVGGLYHYLSHLSDRWNFRDSRARIIPVCHGKTGHLKIPGNLKRNRKIPVGNLYPQ